MRRHSVHDEALDADTNSVAGMFSSRSQEHDTVLSIETQQALHEAIVVMGSL